MLHLHDASPFLPDLPARLRHLTEGEFPAGATLAACLNRVTVW